jgi:hypothetical protein
VNRRGFFSHHRIITGILMSSILVLFVFLVSSCFNLTNVPFEANYLIFGNSCWFLRNSWFTTRANLTVPLGVADSDTFFGMDGTIVLTSMHDPEEFVTNHSRFLLVIGALSCSQAK